MEKESFTDMIHKVMYMAFALLVAFSTGACSDDEDGDGSSSLETPQYEAEAAKYTISDESSPFISIELTASGNYIIRTRNSASELTAASEAMRASASRITLLGNRTFTDIATRSNVVYSNILYGTFTLTGDNEYALDGFGTLVITENGGTSYSLEVTTTGGTSYTLEGNKAGTQTDGEKTDALCRTWNIAQWRTYVRINGSTVLDLTADSYAELVEMLIEWGENIEWEEEDSDYDYSEDYYLMDFYDESAAPTQVVFTKSGTYMVVYANNMLAVSTWQWEDMDSGLLQYSWNPDTFDDDYLGGEVTVEFSGNYMYITEGYSETDEGETYEVALVYTLAEADL